MQNDFQLTVGAMRRRLRSCYPDQEVVTLEGEGPVRASYAQVAERVDRLGRVLERLGVERGDRVATFAWNSQRHFELYLAVPSYGAVLHTLNIRLFPEQVVYIVNHAQDGVIFVDASLVEPLAQLAPEFEGVRHYVVMGDGDLDALPGALSYEQLLEEAGEGEYAWPEIDERAAAALCYTSGTTGNPKGVLYSHRSVSLHSTTICTADAVGLSSRDRVLVIVPMFHVNAWGLPFGAALTGAELLLPGPFLQGEPLARFVEAERATLLAGVPTVLGALLAHVDQHGGDLSSLRGGICGGSAVPRTLMEGFERHGVRILQAWGMTETSPIVTVARPPAGVDEGEEHWAYRTTQGRMVPWTEIRLSEGAGEIEARGPWVAARYYEDPTGDDKFTDDGWLRTGDIGELDERASCASPTAPRTSSSPAASGSRRWRSRRCSSTTPGWSRRRSSPCPTRSGASGRWPAWRWPRARASRPATCASTCRRAWRSGSSPTPSPSSTRCPRRASGSSTRRSCAGSWPRASWRCSARSATRSASRCRSGECRLRPPDR